MSNFDRQAALALSRRRLLKLAMAGAGSLAIPDVALPEVAGASTTSAEAVSFFLVGDTHYFAAKEKPDGLDENSRLTTTRLINWLNKLPGTQVPEAAGGGMLPAPRGVIHAGDLIDSGDKGASPTARKQQEAELAAFSADFGPTAGSGKLTWPTYEVHGNHDGPRGEGIVVPHIIARNKQRKDLADVSDNGLHYAWTWGGVHFLNLGIVVGGDRSIARARRYDPKESLSFLSRYLEKTVGESGAPVIITHHVDVARYSGPCDPQQPPKGNPEWDPCDVHAYHRAISKYNVAALLYGHTHVRKIFRWDGTPREPAQGGLSVFNTDNAGHFNSLTQAFLHFEVGAKEMVVREFATKDRWETGNWTPQVWRFPVTKEPRTK